MDREDANHPPGHVRFGLLCTGTTFPAWQARCIEALLDLPDVRPGLLVLPADETASSQRPRGSHRDRFLFQAYSATLRPRAFRPVEMADRLRDIPSVTCRATTSEESAPQVVESDIRRIRDHNLDFILRFALGNVNGAIYRSSRYGVWSFSHNSDLADGTAPPGFWEIYNGEAVNEAVLLRLADREGGGTVLRRGYFRTALHSLKQNIDGVLFGSARWPSFVARDIRSGHADYLGDPASEKASRKSSLPGNAEMVRFLARKTRYAIRRADGALRRHEEWSIGIVDQPISTFLEPIERAEVRWLQSPGKGRFIADPFGVVVDGAAHILYEDFDYRSSKGVIASIPATDERAPSMPRVAIELPVHASYPYIVVDRNEIYCIPETHAAHEVGLYRAIDFPTRWEKVATILQGVAALDSTIFRHDGRWWLACTDREAGKDLNLFLWYALDLKGPWEPHALNPVKTDVRSSRPAGTPFVHRGTLYRPAQDCSRTYGGGIVLNRVVRLAPAEFREEFVLRIGPLADSPYPDGLHTISSVGDMTLIDSKRHRFIPSAIPYVLRGE